jgi:nitric oxide reductase subunit C
MRRRIAAEALALAAVLLAMRATPVQAGADEGKALYDQKCKVCHSIAGDAGKMADKGGPLDGVGSKRDAAWLKGYVTDPKSKMPAAKMPKMTLAPAQVDDLVAYMLTLRAAGK